MKILTISILALLLLFLNLSNGLAQNKIAIQWAHAYGGTNTEDAFCVIPGNNGGYVFCGDAVSNDGDVTGRHGMTDAWIVSTDNTGHLNWQRCLGGSNNDQAWSIHATEDGGYIVAGETYSTDGDITYNHGGYTDAWVIKLSVTGSIEWQKTYGGSAWDFASSIAPTNDGGYIFTGGTTSTDGDVSGYHPTPTGTTQPDMWVVKIDDTGKVQWQKCLGGSSNDQGTSLQQLKDSSYIIAGITSSNDGDVSGYHDSTDIWVVKLTPNGTLSWQRCLGGSGSENGSSIQQTYDGGYIVGGSTTSHDGDVTHRVRVGYGDGWVIKLTSTGMLDWQRAYGGSNEDGFLDVRQTYDSGYIAAGSTNSTDGDVSGWHHSRTLNDDLWVVRMNASGSIRWQKCLGGSGEDAPYSIIQVADSEFATAGITTSSDGDVTGQHGSGFSYDAWLVKLKEEDTTTSVITLPSVKQKITIYPNPVTQQLTITHAAGLTAVMNDVAGKQVYSTAITNDNQTITLPNIPAGIYYLKLYNQAEVLEKVMKVMKE